MESQESKLKIVKQIREKVELPNQCLGKRLRGKSCTTMLPKGKHTCSICQKIINKSGKLAASGISSGNGQQKRSRIQNT